MSLNLHENCKKRLIEVLTEQLPKISVSGNMFLDRKSAIFQFVYETLARELSENQKYNGKIKDQSLVKIDGYEDTKKTAIRLVEELDSLPWKYMFSVKFHKEISESSLSKIKIQKHDSQIGISKIDEDFTKKYPLQSGIEKRDSNIAGGGLFSVLLHGAKEEWDQDSLCLQIEHEGFVGYYDQSSTFEKAKSDFKAFCD